MTRLADRFNALSLTHQILLPIAVVMMGGFIMFAFLAYSFSKQALLNQSSEALQRESKLVINELENYEQNLRDNALRLSNTFFSMLDGRIEVDSYNTVPVGVYASPVLTLNGRELNADFGYPDEFTRLTGGTATIFVRYNDDFLRISTSLRKKDGSRAFGTLLGTRHPGYGNLMKGEKYIGRAHLFGRDYMTVYSPVVDASGTTIAILYIGFDFTESLQTLYANLNTIRIGDSGGLKLIDTKTGQRLGHDDNTNLLELTDSSGAAIYRQMVETRHGKLQSQSLEAEGASRDKSIAYETFTPWNMLVTAEGYVDEIAADSKTLQQLMITIGILFSLVFVSLSYVAL